MAFFRRLGLREVINARGYTSAYGSALMADEVVKAMVEASSGHVLMSELLDSASDAIVRSTGAEGGCVTAGAAAGIAISVAACMTGSDLHRIEEIPDTAVFPRNEVVFQRGHFSKYTLMIRMTGARLVPFGYVGASGWTTADHLDAAISDRTAALFFLLSEARHVRGELGLQAFIEAAQIRSVPLIVDAAGMSDIRQYVSMGADLVIYSGGKYLLGPGSAGFIAGRADLIQACRMQESGIARAMKVSKEEVAGLIAALERYRDVNAMNYWSGWREMAEELAERLRVIPRIEVRVLDRDYAGDPSAIVQVAFGEKLLGRTAEQITKALDAGNPSIQLRDPQPGLLELDVRELSPRYLPLVVSRLQAELAAGSAEAMRT